LGDEVALIGMVFKKSPISSSVPVLFVVQLIEDDKLVVTSQERSESALSSRSE
jgi:hypothetical protein